MKQLALVQPLEPRQHFAAADLVAANPLADAGSGGGSSADVVDTAAEPGTAALAFPAGDLLATIGNGKGLRRSFRFLDADGTKVRVTLSRGVGEVYTTGTQLDLRVRGTDRRSSLSIVGDGGADNRVQINNIIVEGDLRRLTGNRVDVIESLHVDGNLVRGSVRALVFARVAVAGDLGRLTVIENITGGVLLAGINLGSDRLIGGGDDRFVEAEVGALDVKGSINGATIAAGIDPNNGMFSDDDDIIAGGPGSAISKITARQGVDTQTRFIAATFGRSKIPQAVDPEADPRFRFANS